VRKRKRGITFSSGGGGEARQYRFRLDEGGTLDISTSRAQESHFRRLKREKRGFRPLADFARKGRPRAAALALEIGKKEGGGAKTISI